MAYNQGYQAYWDGYHLSENPWSPLTEPIGYLDWKEGWLDAEDDDYDDEFIIGWWQ